MPGVLSLYTILFASIFLNTLISRIYIVQARVYYKNYKRDPVRLRYFVLCLFIIEAMNSVFGVVLMYEILIINYGNSKKRGSSPKMLITVPLMSSFISTSYQLFVARRIRIISQSLIMPVIISICGLVSFAGGMSLSVFIALGPKYSNFRGATITWLAGAALADVLIAISSSWSLYKRKTLIIAVDNRLSGIIRATIRTGLLTAALAVAYLVVVLVIPDTREKLLWGLPLLLAKVYSIGLLNTLNARSERNRPSTAATDNPNTHFEPENALDAESNNRVIRMGVPSNAVYSSRPPIWLGTLGKGDAVEGIEESR